MKTAVKKKLVVPKALRRRIILFFWLALAALQLLLSASIAPAKSAIGLENRAWKIFPLAAHSHQVNRGQVAEAQRERAPPQRSTAPGCVLGPESAVANVGTGVDGVPQITINAANGQAFEQQGLNYLQGIQNNVEDQVSIRPYLDSGELADFRVRLDAIGTNDEGAVQLTDFKSSDTAGFTPNQQVGYPLLENNGGQVVGYNGGDAYPPGTQIPPTSVNIIRPPDIMMPPAIEGPTEVVTPQNIKSQISSPRSIGTPVDQTH